MHSNASSRFSVYSVLLIFFVKLMMMFFGVYVFSSFTSLGDSQDYIDGRYVDRENWLSPAFILSILGKAASSLFGGSELLVNFIGLLVSFYGLYYALSRLVAPLHVIWAVLFILILPSFSMWSSIFSKESVVVCCGGIFIGGLIEIDLRQRRFLSAYQLLALSALVLFKIYYAPVLLVMLLLTCLRNVEFRYRKVLIFFGVLFGIVVAGTLAFYCSEYLVNEMPKHFSSSGDSTRVNDFWIHPYSFVTYFPVGAMVAFFGPTFSEALNRPILAVFFIESLVLFLLVVYLIFYVLNVRRNSYFSLLLCTVVVFGFLLVHYPFGIFNMGSAIRYRTNFIVFFSIYLAHLSYMVRQMGAER